MSLLRKRRFGARPRPTLRNPIRIAEHDAYVALPQGMETRIDAEDVPRVAPHHWTAFRSRSRRAPAWYVSTKVEGATVYLHRFLLDMAPDDPRQADHKNTDTLDNRKANLRILTVAENGANRAGAYASSATGVRGVSLHRYSPEGVLYVFRCHVRTCPETKYFPANPAGLAQARAYSTAHYDALRARLPA